MVRVHYHRYDHDYEGVSLWIWAPEASQAAPSSDLGPAGWDHYGPYFEINPEWFFGTGMPRSVGLVPRLRHDWRFKDGEDRFWHPAMGKEIWLLADDSDIHLSEPDTSPCVQAAFLDNAQLVTVKLSHSADVGRLNPERFVLQNEHERVCGREARALDPREGRAKTFTIKLAGPVDFLRPHTAQLAGFRAAKLLLRDILLDPNLFYYRGEMGPIYSRQGTTFRVFSPEAHRVELALYEDPGDQEESESLQFAPIGMGAWELAVPGDLHGRAYRLVAHTEDRLSGREVIDPYCRMVTGHDGHGIVVDLRRLDPPGFRPIHRPPQLAGPQDVIMAELHIRDFTIAANSGVPESARGKYLGAAAPGTRIPGTDIATCLDHMVELGVTHVQLLPIQDFDNIETQADYSWGFMPSNFFSPDGWYASNVRDTSRIVETKLMIQAFHAAGIRVIIDVVFNHTAPISPFEFVAPRYYHRRREDGSFWNGSACGNEFRTEAPMARKLIIDTCRFWVEEYGIDGFRFDLMGLIDLDTMLQVTRELKEIDEGLIIMGEPWAGAPPDKVGLERITSKFMVAGTGISAFNNHYLGALKGNADDGTTGYIHDGSNRDAVKRGIQGSIFEWAWHPTDAVQYISSHDNLTLWDKITCSMPDTPEPERIRIQQFAIGLLMVSQGMIFLHTGVEFARTKMGNANSYNAPDHVNQVDWERKIQFKSVFDYTRGMIALRRAHSVFRLGRREEVEARMHFHEQNLPTPSCLMFTVYGGDLTGEVWNDALVLINPEPDAQLFALPKGTWKIYAHDAAVDLNGGLGESRGELLLPPRSISVLAK